MTLAPGFRLGVYEIQSALGAGGMGEVYRARDTRLHRDVALKILPEPFALDSDRLTRFEREAQVLASLNHPNIAAIYGIEEAQRVHGLVLELVDGLTLADRIASGPLSLDEALSIARQVADALGASHEHGIVHRDLKPANIKVRADGTVKVLDFGLAKIVDSFDSAERQVQGHAISHSPTITSPAVTRAGVILGTAAYMAPEQANGRTADASSDIWAFGLVLYEMLTGKRGFAGETTVEVLSNVLKTEPDWTALPTTTPLSIRTLLRRCLQKDRARRLRNIVDARFQIEEALNGPASAAPIDTSSFGRRTRERQWWVAALIIAALAGVVGGARYFRTTQIQPDEVRLEINAPPTTDPTSLAVSPDGKTIVFVASSEGTSRLWLRPMNGISARPLAGTENARFPFWSPDSRSIGFSAEAQLKRVDLSSGSVRLLASSQAMGATWNRDGTILFDRGVGVNLSIVSADGGTPTPVAMSVPALSFDAWFPQFLADQRHYLFYASGAKPGIYVALLGAPEIRQLVDAEAATLATSGYLLFVRQGILMAQAFDPVRLEVTGRPAAISEHVIVNAGEQSVALSAALAGPVAYRTGPAGGQTQLVWLDRSGKVLETVGDLTDVTTHGLSHDGRRVAFSRRLAGTNDIWLADLNRPVPSRLTYDPGNDAFAVWSPDDSRVAWGSTRNGKVDIFVKPSDGTGREVLLFGGHRGQGVSDWSPDGRFVLYHAITRPTGNNQDIWAVPIAENGKPFPVVESETADEINGQFSPDGQWVAYQSDETGRYEVYVQPFRDPGGKRRVSNGGGVQVRWRHDGRELFYIAPGNRFMAASITLDGDRHAVDIGATTTLFVADLPGDPENIVMRHYEVSPDNQRFLVNTRKEVTAPITVILNWKPD